jgi:2,3-bisphosphoglycerate-dependent phosphoglycerate mutase
MNIRMKLSALALAAVALATSGAVTAQDSAPADVAVDLRPVTVIALRHAEKGDDDPRDPGLSQAGEARSKQLAKLLGHCGVTHIFATGYRRTQATVAPMASDLGLKVVEYNPGDMTGLMTTIGELPPGSVAVVSGHSNTTPGVVAALGAEVQDLTEFRGMQVLGEDQYDRAFFITLPNAGTKSPVSMLEIRYGE